MYMLGKTPEFNDSIQFPCRGDIRSGHPTGIAAPPTAVSGAGRCAAVRANARSRSSLGCGQTGPSSNHHGRRPCCDRMRALVSTGERSSSPPPAVRWQLLSSPRGHRTWGRHDSAEPEVGRGAPSRGNGPECWGTRTAPSRGNGAETLFVPQGFGRTNLSSLPTRNPRHEECKDERDEQDDDNE